MPRPKGSADLLEDRRKRALTPGPPRELKPAHGHRLVKLLLRGLLAFGYRTNL
jgi:hypothetical protein